MEKINLISFIEELNKQIFVSAFNGEELEIEKNDLSELYMHKVLYFLYGYFYTEFKKELFKNARFQAWKYGPVEIDLRNQFKLDDKKIKNIDKFNIEVNENEKKFLKRIIENLLNFSTWKIVELSHYTDPWKNNFVSNNWKDIPIKEIQSYFGKL